VVKVASVAEQAALHPAELCIITGGEPALYDLFPLTRVLHQSGKKTHLETSAAYPLTGEWDWICISPKKFKRPLEQNLKLADELKVVIYHQSDFEWGEEYAKQVSSKCLLFLQPEWGREKEMLPLMLEYVKKNPQWQISLQLHKYLHVP
jgi:organic radical activating enzyme